MLLRKINGTTFNIGASECLTHHNDTPLNHNRNMFTSSVNVSEHAF